MQHWALMCVADIGGAWTGSATGGLGEALFVKERYFGADEALDLLVLQDLLRRSADLLEALQTRARGADPRGESL
ncbi:MAG: hypothetical protein ACREUT_04205 [Steroidobacteraceae bacterium]